MFGRKCGPLVDGETPMANKEQRGSREKRKPKKEKPKSGPHVSTYSGGTMKTSAGKKAGR